MRKERNTVAVAIALSAMMVLPGFSLLAVAGDLGYYGEPAGALQVAAPPGTGPDILYIKFDGIDGETQEKNHVAWSNALSFSQVHAASDSGTDGMRRAAGVIFEDVVVTKEIDKASPKLAEAVCKGTVFPSVQIHVTREFPDGSKTYYACELKTVFVTSYETVFTQEVSPGGSSQGGEMPPLEEISLSFGEIKATYTEYDETGRAKGNVEYSWKIGESRSPL